MRPNLSRVATVAVVWALACSAGRAQTTYEWSQTEAGSWNWSTPGNWSTSPPSGTGSTTDVLRFFPAYPTFPTGFALTANNDVGPYTLNSLELRSGTSSGTSTITISGSALTFAGASPRIFLTYPNAVSATISNDLVLNSGLSLVPNPNGLGLIDA